MPILYTVRYALPNVLTRFCPKFPPVHKWRTCNLIPAKFLRAEVELFPTRKLLTMYNKTIMKPLGTCTVAVSNPKNSKTYQIEFVVVDNDQ